MTYTNPTGLPQPNVGQNPPRYDNWYAHRTTKIVMATVGAFALVFGIYLLFA
jgi:hypothetical protein